VNLPQQVRREIEERFGAICAVQTVGGGCINPAARVELRDRPVFLKFNPHAPAGFFVVEARGLERLRAAAAELRVPHVLGVEEGTADTPGWLLLEWLEPTRKDADFDARLGRGLAGLHRGQNAAAGWGWDEEGFIGPLPQQNGMMSDWPIFWRERRLEPQLQRARGAGRVPGREQEWGELFARLPELLACAEADGPSLLHGDLWSGNVLAAQGSAGAGAEPALVDPSVYRGHREVDLAMSELFGGFGPGFYTAYAEAWPLEPGYREQRRAVYQLYYLLVHVNLFGDAYIQQTAGVLRDVLSAS
jgi:fructosamine-3-kinase